MGWGSRALGRSQDPSWSRRSAISPYTLPSFSAKSIGVGETDNILCQLNSITLFLQGQEEGEENISLLWGLPFHLPGPYQVVLVPQPSSCISPHLSPSAIHSSLRKQILLFLAVLCQVSGSIPPLLFPARRQFHFFWVVAAPAVAGINLPLLLAATFQPLCFSEQISLYWGVGEHQPQLVQVVGDSGDCLNH